MNPHLLSELIRIRLELEAALAAAYDGDGLGKLRAAVWIATTELARVTRAAEQPEVLPYVMEADDAE